MLVTVRSFAKINLGLRIGPARDDGFHELLTVYQTIGLHDVIRVSVSRGSRRGPEIEIRCADPRVPANESNTCYRIVAKALRIFKTNQRVLIEIEKRLPVQGGLGGASANAVATLLALERALKKSLPAAERLRIAAEVGSDLPLFLVGGAVLGVGRGEQVYPLPDLPQLACVVVTPEVGVSTPNAFAEWDKQTGGAGGAAMAAASLEGGGRKPAELHSADGRGARPHTSNPHTGNSYTEPAKLTGLAPSDRMNELGRQLSAWLSELHLGAPSVRNERRGRHENPLLALVRTGIANDFEQVVFPEYPELCEGKRALERAGAKYASLSGSGSALYGLFASRSEALRAVVRLRKQGWTAQATVTLPRKAYWQKFLVSS
jgi:4-diphosphocytidyl-2-C-methyl-D-erythritol kinase